MTMPPSAAPAAAAAWGAPAWAAPCRWRSSRPPPLSASCWLPTRRSAGAGGAGANGGSGYGGGIAVGGRTIYDGPDGSSVNLSDSVVNANQAIGGTGGTGAVGGSGYGGGAFVGATESNITPSLAVSHSIINANSADGGAGSDGSGAGIGGGVYDLGDFSAIATVLEGNHASTSNDDIFG